MIKSLFYFFAFCLITAQSAFALPVLKIQEDTILYSKLGINFPYNFSANYDFEGIIKLSNCSGALVRYETSKDTDFALVLTNGHCLQGGFLKAGEVIYNKPTSRTFGLYNSQGKIIANLLSTHIAYATMTKTDIAFYRLNMSYADIKAKFGINALLLSDKKANISDKIEIISGYWNRGYSCSVQYFVPYMKEDKWTWEDSIRYLQPGCETIGGTSGSPIILAGTRTVIGINNTGNDDGAECTLMNPCEIDEKGKVSVFKGASYGQQTYWTYSCLTEQNEIDLTKEGCLLPK